MASVPVLNILKGEVLIPWDRLPVSVDYAARLHDALTSETLDDLQRDGTKFCFRHRRGFHQSVPRPGGNNWLFGGVDGGMFSISESKDNLAVHYKLSLQSGFKFFLAVAAILTFVIYQNGSRWGPVFGLYTLSLYFLVFVVQRFRVRRWLWKIMTAQTLPAPRPLSVPDGG